jgi:hypothetical protein
MRPLSRIEYDSYLRLIEQLDELIAAFEQHPDITTREQAITLLSGLDALHREGLGRLVERLRSAGAGEMLDHAASDPVVKTLLGLYDLAELELPAEEPPSNVAFVPIEALTVRGKRPGTGRSRDSDSPEVEVA